MGLLITSCIFWVLFSCMACGFGISHLYENKNILGKIFITIFLTPGILLIGSFLLVLIPLNILCEKLFLEESRTVKASLMDWLDNNNYF